MVLPNFPTDGGDGERTSKVRLPLELGSDRHETSATRVSDDLQISIFRRRTFFFRKKIRIFFFGFSSFSVDFRGARLFLTSKSSSSRFFALDGQIFRSVRPLGLIFRFFTVRTATCGGKARVTEIPGGASPTLTGHHFKKFALRANSLQ